MFKKIFWIGILLLLLGGSAYWAASQGLISIPGLFPPPAVAQPALVKPPPPPPAPITPPAPPPPVVVQTPLPPPAQANPDAGKLRGTKETDWDHTWVTLNGKRVMAIYDVRLAGNLNVAIANPFGNVSSRVDQLPQGFLDSWGITGDVIDQKVSAINDQLKAQAEAQALEAQTKAQAAIAAQTTNMGFKVIQVVNKSEVIASVEGSAFGYTLIHISGIDASGMTADNVYTAKVRRNGVFSYNTGSGTTQIDNYTGVPPGATP
jgi:hypothetical protein